jgi:N-acetylmuramic acid 6-phosphate etherase
MKTNYTPGFIFGAARVDAATAHAVLEQCQFQVKLALVVLLKKQTIEQAQLLLDRANGNACAVLRT